MEWAAFYYFSCSGCRVQEVRTASALSDLGCDDSANQQQMRDALINRDNTMSCDE